MLASGLARASSRDEYRSRTGYRDAFPEDVSRTEPSAYDSHEVRGRVTLRSPHQSSAGAVGTSGLGQIVGPRCTRQSWTDS
jgi:hypothetical protein